jgi:hypothetical protein
LTLLEEGVMFCTKTKKYFCMVCMVLRLLCPAILVLLLCCILFHYNLFLVVCDSYPYLIILYFVICFILFVFWCCWGKGKSKKKAQPVDSVAGCSLSKSDLYSASIQLIIHAENTTWTRSSNFLLANSILMLAWATIFSSSLCDQRKAVFLFLLSSLGFVLSFVWAPFSYRSRRYLESFRKTGIALEQNLRPPRPEGPLSASGIIPFSKMEEDAKSQILTVFIPLTFAAVFLAAFLKSLCLIATYIL